MEDNLWIFTFGCGQPLGGKCVKIEGTYEEARDKMCAQFGKEWAFQYSNTEWEGYKNDPNRKWPMEEEIYIEGISYKE